MMQGTTTHQKPQPVFKVKTNIKAGYYLGIALSAGQGQRWPGHRGVVVTRGVLHRA